MPYSIEITADAEADLGVYPAYERKIITAGVRQQLSNEPLVETKNRKRLRPHAITPWELRLGHYRVFYTVDGDTMTITVMAVGHKDRNRVFIRGQRVTL